MKKNIFNYSLMAALMCGLSMGFVACSDDDNNNVTNEVMNPEQTDEALDAWLWVSTLTDADEQTDNWQQKSYEITVGQQSTNTGDRLVFVSDFADARKTFASWAGCDPDELKAAKTLKAGELATLNWQPAAAGAQNIAVVTIDSKKLLKGATRIVFCTEDQAGDNATAINGNCYYRLGDVVKDDEGFYWVCVQPSFLGKKNNDSYWLNVFNENPETNPSRVGDNVPAIPEKYIYSKYDKKYNGNTILLPTCLKTDRKQLFNFANFLWAVADSMGFSYDDTRKGLCGIDYKYHGHHYVMKVSKFWQEEKLFEAILNMSYEDFSKFKRQLHFFHHGYHWKVGSTAGVWMYTSDRLEDDYTGNMDTDDTLYEMKKSGEGYGFNIHRYAGNPNVPNIVSRLGDDRAPAYQFTPEFDNCYWVVRMATGKQLDKNYKPYKALDENKFETVYSFNESMKQEVGEGTDVIEDDDDALLNPVLEPEDDNDDEIDDQED